MTHIEPTRGGFADNRGKFSEAPPKRGAEIEVEPGRTGAINGEIDFTWIQRNVLLTPRHRKPVDIEHELKTIASVNIVDAEDAPVSLIVHDNEWTKRGEGDVDLIMVAREYRTFEDGLYKQVLDGRDRGEPVPATPEWIADRFPAYQQRYEGETEVEAADNARAPFDSYISVDGQVWQRASEPVYCVMTFGMGSNHGGTSLSMSGAPDTTDHAGGECYFPADQYDEAVAYAVNVAERRGDNESVARIRKTKQIDVLDPSIVGSSWRPAPRISTVREYSLTDENYDRELKNFRAQLSKIPGAVVVSGGTTRIDYSRLTEGQADSYRQYVVKGIDLGRM
jgi:hypothetical protein